MNNKFCYWSVADGDHGKMMAAVVHSARRVGVQENFHVWSDQRIPGAITHECGQFKKDHYLFKLDFLKNEAHKLMYDYFIFIDADSWFVRNPENILDRCHNSPVHIGLESDCTGENLVRDDWWDCPLPTYVQLMREKGVRSSKVYNMNAGLWIVHRDAMDHVHRLAYEFWHYASSKGYKFTEEAPLAYVAHMMTGDPEKHILKNNTDLWASDWLGHWKDRIPEDEEWNFTDYMTGELIPVKPAIVHAMRSKQVLKEYGEKLR